MINFLKNNIFIVIGVSLTLIAFEIFTTMQNVAILGIGILFLVSTSWVKQSFVKRFLFIIGFFFILLSLLLTKSIWLLLVAILLIILLYRTPEGNEFFFFGESVLHPFQTKEQYHGIQLVQPQSGQRSLLINQSLFDSREENKNVYEWDDINLVYIGGNSIIDLGNTILPAGENIVMIRKLFGRTRVIIPKDIGLRLNISAVSGQVVFESQQYLLRGDNFQWTSPAYSDSDRKLKVIISIVTGDIEVILL